MTTERLIALVQSAVSTVLGGALLGWQGTREHPDATTMLISAGLLGYPGILSLWQLRGADMTVPSSPPASPLPASSPSSPSSTEP